MSRGGKNGCYGSYSEEDGLLKCIEDKVTNGKGMGFGLFSTANLIRDCSSELDIYSGNKRLHFDINGKTVEDISYWQGTVVFMRLRADVSIDPEKVVDYRTNCAEQYNEQFINDDDDTLDDLW